jgi:uncharacterized membrane protein
MIHVNKSIVIGASVEKVFAYIDNPENLVDIWPSLLEVTDVEMTEKRIGDCYKWVYKIAGMRLSGESKVAEYEKNKRIVRKASGGASTTHAHIFETEGQGTKYTLDVEYTIPVPILGKLAEPIIRKMNENEADVLLANLKAMMEG